MNDPFEPLQETSRVSCPHCGEAVEILVDAGGGAHQQYVEDCPVCCRPWQVTVHIRTDGALQVEVALPG